MARDESTPAQTPGTRLATTLLGFPVMCALRDRLRENTIGLGDRGNDPLITLAYQADSNTRDQIRIHSVTKGNEERKYTGNRRVFETGMVQGTIVCFRGDTDGERAIASAWAFLNAVRDALNDDLSLGTGFGNASCQLDAYDLICVAGSDGHTWMAQIDFDLSYTGHVTASDPI